MSTKTLEHAPNAALSPLPEAQSTVSAAAIHQVITAGDLSVLSEHDRIAYYLESCRDLGLNWRTQPFALVKLKGGVMKLYLTVDGAEQLAAVNRLRVEVARTEQIKGAYIVHMRATLPDGRGVTKMGGKDIHNLAGDALIDAMKKAESQAYRRAVKAAASLATFDPAAQLVPLPHTEIEEASRSVLAMTNLEGSVDPETGELTLELGSGAPDEEEIADAEWTALSTPRVFDTSPATQEAINGLARKAKHAFGFTHINEFSSWMHQVGFDIGALTMADVANARALIDNEGLTPPPETVID